jgi:phosphocarrier protein
MINLTVKVPFKEGLHARPASELVKICQNIKSNITFKKGETEIDPKSILGIMSLGAAYGDDIVITADGEDEASAVSSLKNFFQMS